MLSYADVHQTEFPKLLRLCHWFFCTTDELTALGGDISHPDRFFKRWSLGGLCLKEGAAGVRLLMAGRDLHVPALSSHAVVDTTGAGDSLAGGMLSRWLAGGGGIESLFDAAVWGVACASITIESVGVGAIATATPEQVAERAEEVWACVRANQRSRS